MVLILDELMKGFFIYVKNYGDSGKEGAIIGVSTILSFLFLFLSSFFLFYFGLSLLEIIGVSGFVLLAVFFYFLLNLFLKKIYVKQKRELLFKKNRLWSYYLVGPLSFIISIFILFLSFRFM